jgi:hypothetical protein
VHGRWALRPGDVPDPRARRGTRRVTARSGALQPAHGSAPTRCGLCRRRLRSRASTGRTIARPGSAA